MSCPWAPPDPRSGLLPVPPGKGWPASPQACCCSNPALCGLLPLEADRLLLCRGTTQTSAGFKAEPQGEENFPAWRPRVLGLPRPLVEGTELCPGLYCHLSPAFPRLCCPLSSLLLPLVIHHDCTATGYQARAKRWGHRMCPVTMTLSLP